MPLHAHAPAGGASTSEPFAAAAASAVMRVVDDDDKETPVAPVEKQTRSVVLRRAKQSLSVVIQTRLADLLLGAERSRGAAAPVAA